MKKKNKYFEKGFSFVEVMIVIAIIGVLASVVIISMSAAKKRNENAATIAMVKDYEKAIYNFMNLSNHRNYPNIYTGPPDFIPSNVLDCLGPDNNCWWGLNLGRSSDIDSGGVSPDIQDYIPDLPTRTMTASSCGGFFNYESPMYYQNSSGIDRNRIYFALYGQNTCETGTFSWNLGTRCVGCYITIQK